MSEPAASCPFCAAILAQDKMPAHMAKDHKQGPEKKGAIDAPERPEGNE